MRDFPLLALCTLLPLTAHADEHAHASLDSHAHGVMHMDAVLDGNTLSIAIESPTMNFLGFEHVPASDAEKSRLTATRELLEQPLKLISLPVSADCNVHSVDVESALFDAKPQANKHSDIDASYTLTCKTPSALKSLSLAPLFKQFPATEEVEVQWVGPNGQLGAELTPDSPTLGF